MTQKTLANGVIETHTFDAAGRETKVEQRNASGVLSSFTSVYDNVNQRTSVSEAGGSATAYAYDDDGQLLSETRTGNHPYSIAYVYDEVGNRTRKVEGDLTTSYVYDDANELVSQETRDSSHVVVSQGTSSYDANGNVTQQVEDGQITSFIWNPQNYLMSVRAPDGSSESYAYCGEGIRRTVTNASGLRRFIRDGQNILLEADGNGATIRRYTHMGESWGALLSLHEGQSSRYYGFDGNANTRVLTDASGAVSDAYLYSAFGEELQMSGSSANPLRFGGEVGYYRDEAERVYVRARHLDVSDGRWLSRDPIGFGGGDWNLYRYVGNDPTVLVDPSGESPIMIKKRLPGQICSDATLKKLSSAITNSCKTEKTACNNSYRKGYKTAAEKCNYLRRGYVSIRSCYQARIRRDHTCFVRPDKGHRIAQQDTKKGMDKCYNESARCAGTGFFYKQDGIASLLMDTSCPTPT